MGGDHLEMKRKWGKPGAKPPPTPLPPLSWPDSPDSGHKRWRWICQTAQPALTRQRIDTGRWGGGSHWWLPACWSLWSCCSCSQTWQWPNLLRWNGRFADWWADLRPEHKTFVRNTHRFQTHTLLCVCVCVCHEQDVRGALWQTVFHTWVIRGLHKPA